MLYYVIKNDNYHQYIIETEDETIPNGFIRITKLYQAVEIKEKGNFLVKMYNSEDKDTYLLPEVSGKDYLFNLSDSSEIIGLSKKPIWKEISVEMYNNIIAELKEKSAEMLTGWKNDSRTI